MLRSGNSDRVAERRGPEPPAMAALADSRIRLPCLDGLRGVAILLVMWHHFTMFGGMDPSCFADKVYYRSAMSAWCGVDLFFVLSGFLITRILADSVGSDHYFRNFYLRRALRIFPLYYGFLVVMFWIVPATFAVSPEFREVVREQAWYWSYLSNIKIAVDYWPEFPGIGHFWSLAVEEQFYLIWPLVVWTISRRRLMSLCGMLIGAALVLRCCLAWADVHPVAAYVLMPTRADSLMVGSLIALACRDSTHAARLAASVTPVAVVSATLLAGFFVWRRGLDTEDTLISTLGLTLLALFSGTQVFLAAARDTDAGLNRLLRTRGLRFLGKYSYGLYVFHIPVALGLHNILGSGYGIPSIMNSQVPGQLVFALLAGLTSVVLALLSWHVLEQPFLKLKKRFDYKVRTVES